MVQAARDKADSEGQKARVLIVDDDDRNLLALTQVLNDVAQVVTASSGKDALRLLLNQDFAVILLDVFMPGMDGYEVACLIRERQHTARIPIIFLSAVNKEAEHMLRGYAMGAVDYVFKPVDSVVLRSKVSVFVDLYDMRRQIEVKNRAARELREAKFRAELEKLRIQRELDESRVRQAAIVSSLPIILYQEAETSGPRVPHFVGGNFDAVTGFSFEAVRDRPSLWTDRLHPEDRNRALAALEERRLTGAMAIEYRWQCASGEYKYFLDQAVRLSPGDGEAPDYAGTLIDVSERKQLEARLLQAGKLEAIGQLTGGVAHDFNNLLAAVLGGIGLLEKRVEFPAREQLILEHMRHAAENGAALVRRMMAFARKQDLHPTSVAPARLRDSVLGLVEHSLGGNISVEWHHDEATRNFHIDQGQLELALVNLVINARDAMPQGGRITIRCCDLHPDEAVVHGLDGAWYMLLSVADEGSGIPLEYIDRVVEPFFTTKELGKGTGLGLSMVSGFAQQSGGTLAIRSAPAAGTTMELVLPSSSAPATPKKLASGAIPALDISQRSILLVDDDDAVRDILSEQLSDMKLKVVSASSGAQAMDILAEYGCGIDVMLTDFAMPDMNGTETIRRARNLYPQLHAILMTGYAEDHMLPRDEDAIAILRKPIDLDMLRQELSKQLHRMAVRCSVG